MAPRVVMLFGLSADPPTGARGHAGIVQWGATVLQVPLEDGALAPVDEVWVLPVFQHAYVEKQQMTPYPHRLAMARLAFEHLPGLEGRVRVLETEREVTEGMQTEAASAGRDPKTVWAGTLDVVAWLVARHPGVRFAVVLGADTYADYLAGKWKGGRALEREAAVIGIPRRGFPALAADSAALPAESAVFAADGTAFLVEAPALGAVSSTQLRASADPVLWEAETQPAVRAYVRAHRLYPYGQRANGQ